MPDDQSTTATAEETAAATPTKGTDAATPQQTGTDGQGTDAATSPSAASVETPTAPGADAPTDAAPFTSIDPSKLPPELLPVYKQMQADYTRKTQQAAKLSDDALVRAKAGLATDPAAQAQAQQQVQPQAQQPDFSVMDSQQIVQYLAQTVEQQVQQRLEAQIRPVLSTLERREVDTIIRAEIGEAKAKYADFDDHAPDMMKLSEQQVAVKVAGRTQSVPLGEVLSIEQLYQLSTYGKQRQEGVNDAYAAQAQKKAEAPVQTTAGGQSAPSDKAMTWDESVAAAKRQHGVS